MSDWEFKPNDFDTGYAGENERCAAFANRKLAEERAKMPVVFAYLGEDLNPAEYIWGNNTDGDTHQARLDGIREIEK